MDDPILARSDAADATYSGVALTNDIRTSRPSPHGHVRRPSISDWTSMILPDVGKPSMQVLQGRKCSRPGLPKSAIRAPVLRRLVDDLDDPAGADGAATFADREPQTAIHGDGLAQLHGG